MERTSPAAATESRPPVSLSSTTAIAQRARSEGGSGPALLTDPCGLQSLSWVQALVMLLAAAFIGYALAVQL